MTVDERNKLFDNIMNDNEMFATKESTQSFAELVDEYISAFEELSFLIKEYRKVYDTRAALNESVSIKSVESILAELTEHVSLQSSQIDALNQRIADQLKAIQRANKINSRKHIKPIVVSWNDDGSNISGEERKQRFIAVLHKAKSDIDQMSRVETNIKKLRHAKNQLVQLLVNNRLLTNDEAAQLR